jgi:hypothetical protein
VVAVVDFSCVKGTNEGGSKIKKIEPAESSMKVRERNVNQIQTGVVFHRKEQSAQTFRVYFFFFFFFNTSKSIP